MATSPLMYKNVLVVVKQTAYQTYRQLKARGQAPLALRWGRLEDRDRVHRECVEELLRILHANGCVTEVVPREELYHHHMPNHDLVIAVGGDGTTLSASHFVRGNVPLLGVNSDPDESMPHAGDGSAAAASSQVSAGDDNPLNLKSSGNAENASTTGEAAALALETDTRRSVGALCACTSRTMKSMLPGMLFRDVLPKPRARIRLTVTSTYNETTLVPALNDVLVAHPSPAAMSRFLLKTDAACPSSFRETAEREKVNDFDGSRSGSGGVGRRQMVMNSRSSGLWVSTATGSTGAMAGAGGQPMDTTSTELQWRINNEAPAGKRGPAGPSPGALVGAGEMLGVRWNSHKGACYVDGEYVVHKLELGDELRFSADAKPLLLF